MAKGKRSTGRKKEKKNVPVGICHIKATFNNTIVTFSDPQGNVISWSSTGAAGFKGSRKSTPYAAKTAAEEAVKRAKEHGLKQVEVEVHGPGSGREAALRALGTEGLKITTIRDVTPVPHNGCKPPKMRRI